MKNEMKKEVAIGTWFKKGELQFRRDLCLASILTLSRDISSEYPDCAYTAKDYSSFPSSPKIEDPVSELFKDIRNREIDFILLGENDVISDNQELHKKFKMQCFINCVTPIFTPEYLAEAIEAASKTIDIRNELRGFLYDE